MESISIKKFDFGRSYLTSGSKSMLFNLVERVGKELTFDVLSGKKEVMKVKGTAKVVLENGVAQEVVRIDVFDAFFTLKATVSKRVVEKKNVASEKEDDEDTSGNVVPLEQEKLLHVI